MHTYGAVMADMTSGKYVRFGRYLRELREARKFSQRGLAGGLGCDKMTVWHWETGGFLPSDDNLALINRELKLTPAEFATLGAIHDQAQREKASGQGFSRELQKDLAKAFAELERDWIPLYKPTDSIDPAKITTGAQRWDGLHVYGPTDMRGRLVFAFRISDDAMAPRFNSSDIVFADLDLALESGKPVVACLGGRVLCRLYEEQGKKVVLKAMSPDAKVIVTPKTRLQWRYRVALRVSDER